MYVLQTAQLVAVCAKENSVPGAESCQCADACDNAHNYVWEERAEDGEGDEEP